MTKLHQYISECLAEGLAEDRVQKLYLKLEFNNKVKTMVTGYDKIPEERRIRMTKEIAETLIEEKGDAAYLYALEKLNTYDPMYSRPEMWRDVLSWLDELGGQDGGRTGGVPPSDRPGES